MPVQQTVALRIRSPKTRSPPRGTDVQADQEGRSFAGILTENWALQGIL